MLDAETLEQQANLYIERHPSIKSEIDSHVKNQTLFPFFLAQVKANCYQIVSYILNYCFDSAQARADFGNQRDEEGNTAYHYAAQSGFEKVIAILNDKRAFKNERKYFRYTIKNVQGKQPFDLVCACKSSLAFNSMWDGRVNKPNHNPVTQGNLLAACETGFADRVKKMIDHPKCKLGLITSVADDAKAQSFTSAIKKLLQDKIDAFTPSTTGATTPVQPQ